VGVMVKKKLVVAPKVTIEDAISFLRDLSAQYDAKIKKLQEDKAKIDRILSYLTSPEEVEEIEEVMKEEEELL
jgi:hypothetical protein